MASKLMPRHRQINGRDVAAEMSANLYYLHMAALEFAQQRRNTVIVLRAIVKDLRQWHERTRKAKLYGGGAGVLGAGLVLGGMMFPSLRGALHLGAFLGSAGTVAAVGGVAVDAYTSNKAQEEVKQILERDRQAYERFVSLVESRQSSWTTEDTAATVAGLGILGRVNREVNIPGSLLTFVSAVGEEFGVGVVVAGAAIFTIAAVPFNLYHLITNVNASDPKVVQAIENIIGLLEVK